jgi:hypothetical protein
MRFGGHLHPSVWIGGCVIFAAYPLFTEVRRDGEGKTGTSQALFSPSLGDLWGHRSDHAKRHEHGNEDGQLLHEDLIVVL